MADRKMASASLLILLLTLVEGEVVGQRDYNSLAGEDDSGTVYCYQCSSITDRDCAHVDPLDQDASYKFVLPCLDDEKYNGSKPFCRKIVQRILPRDNMEIVIRKCGWVRHPRLDCYSVRNEDHTETSCQCFERACNGAPAPQQPFTLLTSALSAALLLRHL